MSGIAADYLDRFAAHICRFIGRLLKRFIILSMFNIFDRHYKLDYNKSQAVKYNVTDLLGSNKNCYFLIVTLLSILR